MPAYSVPYDLNRQGQNYSALYDELRRTGTWWHRLDSKWLIVTTETASQLANRLRAVIDSNDSLLVIEVRNRAGNLAAGWLDQEAWNWITNNVPG
jgi:hypothetical protein